MDDTTGKNPNEGSFVPGYPNAETWAGMCKEERDAFERKYQALGAPRNPPAQKRMTRTSRLATQWPD